MGLTTWKNAPDGRVLKSDVTVAKNYLLEKEIRQLERAVSSYFDYIENRIERQNTFNMEQFAASVDKFLTFNDYKINHCDDTLRCNVRVLHISLAASFSYHVRPSAGSSC